jgi:prophage regulatory protein
MNDKPIRLLSHDDLKERGIKYTKVSLWRLERKGRFPKRVNTGARSVAWVESEIDDYLRGLIAQRDANAA